MNRHASGETSFSYLKHSKRTLVASAILLLIALLSGTALVSQTGQRKPVTSDLAQQNMSLVAASPADIKAVLVSDPGLMVELKRWVAKNATDHGQIISESDLTNDAIFD